VLTVGIVSKGNRPMDDRRFLCFYEGHGAEWEAISVDFDIAVTGRSFDEVKALLKSAIHSYIEDAEKQEPIARKHLLGRRMPAMVRLKWRLKIALHNAARSRNGTDLPSDGRFEVACHV
jgi:hypothetical protein